MTNTVYTYGCSVTQHIWPTWADIVCHSAVISGYSGFNAGLSGSGNTGIKRSVIQTHEKYGISSKDLVLVMWTSWLREDRLTFKDTHHDPRYTEALDYPVHTRCGNVLNTPFYNIHFTSEYVNLDHYIINSISEITTIRKAVDLTFEGHISVEEGLKQAHQQNLVDNTTAASTYSTFTQDLCLPNPFRLTLSGGGDCDATVQYPEYVAYYECDGHPVPQHALDYVLKYVEPTLPFAIKQETLDWVEQWNQRLLSELEQYRSGPPGTGERMMKHKSKWAPYMADKMTQERLQLGIRTHSDLWGGDLAHPDRVDTTRILNQFIRHNRNLG
tara:strand:- start:2171 stop:3154 length:984 start_codon:yes stop_codon:yes gene_type:complete